MTLPTIIVEKKPLDGLDTYCIWCYTIVNPDGFNQGDEYALDFPSDTDILDPKEAKKIKGSPPYELDSEHGRRITEAGQTELEICFVATCKEQKGTDVRLERRPQISIPVESSGMDMITHGHGPWEKVPWEDAPEGVGPMIGPAAIASAPVTSTDQMGLIAEFEARKMAALLGIQWTAQRIPQIAKSIRRQTIFVSSLPVWDEEESTEDKGE